MIGDTAGRVAVTDLPEDVLGVFREFRTAEMSILDREGPPLAWPVFPFFLPDRGIFQGDHLDRAAPEGLQRPPQYRFRPALSPGGAGAGNATCPNVIHTDVREFEEDVRRGPPSRRWRWILWLAGGFILLAAVGNGLYPWPVSEGGPNPYGIEGGERTLLLVTNLAGIMLGIGIGASVISLIVRYRRGSRHERQLLKWFLTAAAILPLAVVVGEQGDQELQPIVVPAALALLPMAIGVAILRYRLYDIDLVINRTLVYGALTALLGLVYIGSVVVLGGLLPVEGNDLAVAGSTLAVAALFSPARRRIQGFVDRRFYRRSYDAARTVERFSARLRDEVDLDTPSSDPQTVVRETLQPASVSVWLRQEGRGP